MAKYVADFDHHSWLRKFQAASKAGEGFRELRAAIFQNTVHLTQNGGYQVNGLHFLIANAGVLAGAELYDRPLQLEPPARGLSPTRFTVVKADCLEAAQALINSGLNPAVLNMASRQTPGGGVYNGAGAQEENLFRRTNMFLSLFQFSQLAEIYGLQRHSSKSYPLDRDHGGAYSPNITVFRGSEANGYFLLQKPFKIAVVTVPALNHPQLQEVTGELRLVDSLVAPTKEKIRTILRIAASHGHDSLVLSAFGCGAFANPPGHMAELFLETFQETEFETRFQTVVFAIIGDHNSFRRHNPQGNILPFAEVFS
ncbi:MAG: TIGR02452 family protein [Deltaproteobacteria bacterium]|jgi:uncharacterized protein (TIGR02452 family)|nr:TIGR02452 family protein [Deltaproteobacteria bacterium]